VLTLFAGTAFAALGILDELKLISIEEHVSILMYNGLMPIGFVMIPCGALLGTLSEISMSLIDLNRKTEGQHGTS
jgi:hypothetical protein